MFIVRMLILNEQTKLPVDISWWDFNCILSAFYRHGPTVFSFRCLWQYTQKQTLCSHKWNDNYEVSSHPPFFTNRFLDCWIYIISGSIKNKSLTKTLFLKTIKSAFQCRIRWNFWAIHDFRQNFRQCQEIVQFPISFFLIYNSRSN